MDMAAAHWQVLTWLTRSMEYNLHILATVALSPSSSTGSDQINVQGPKAK